MDIFIFLVWLGGFNLAYTEYKVSWFKAFFWPYYFGRHFAFYTFALKTMAEVLNEQQKKQRMH